MSEIQQFPLGGAATAEDLAIYEADAVPVVAEENILAAITRVARELRQNLDDVTRAEEDLKAALNRVRLLTEKTLPTLMDRAAQTELTTLDGYCLKRGSVIRASIPKGREGAAFAWLRQNKQGSIIKTEIKATFGAGEEQRAEQAAQILTAEGIAHEDKQAVHPQTLAAVIRELLKKGVDVPLETLGAHEQAFVKMEPSKDARSARRAG